MRMSYIYNHKMVPPIFLTIRMIFVSGEKVDRRDLLTLPSTSNHCSPKSSPLNSPHNTALLSPLFLPHSPRNGVTGNTSANGLRTRAGSLPRTPTSSQTRFSRSAGAAVVPGSPPSARAVFRGSGDGQQHQPRSITSTLLLRDDTISVALNEVNFSLSSNDSQICKADLISATNRDVNFTQYSNESVNIHDNGECHSFTNHSKVVPDLSEPSVSIAEQESKHTSASYSSITDNTIPAHRDNIPVSDAENYNSRVTTNDIDRKILEAFSAVVCEMEDDPSRQRCVVASSRDDLETRSICDPNLASCEIIRPVNYVNKNEDFIQVFYPPNHSNNLLSNNNCDKQLVDASSSSYSDNNNSVIDNKLGNMTSPRPSVQPNAISANSVSSRIAKFNSLGYENIQIKDNSNTVSVTNKNKPHECDQVPSSCNKNYEPSCKSNCCDGNGKVTKEKMYCNKENVYSLQSVDKKNNLIQSSLKQLGLQDITYKKLTDVSRDLLNAEQSGRHPEYSQHHHLIETCESKEFIADKSQFLDDCEISSNISTVGGDVASIFSPAMKQPLSADDTFQKSDESSLLSLNESYIINTGFILADDCPVELLDSAIEASATAAVSRRARRSTVQPCFRGHQPSGSPAASPPLSDQAADTNNKQRQRSPLGVGQRCALEENVEAESSNLLCTTSNSSHVIRRPSPPYHVHCSPTHNTNTRTIGAIHEAVPLHCAWSARYEDAMPSPSPPYLPKHAKHRVSLMEFIIS